MHSSPKPNQHPHSAPATKGGHFKDLILNELADSANVAQFVSFGPGSEPQLRFMRVHGHEKQGWDGSVRKAVGILLEECIAHSANVRSFDPSQPKAHDFLYGLSNLEEIEGAVRSYAAAGLHTIVNETIDVNDGGVSGVSYAGLIEFAPEDTPRCVEKPGTASLPIDMGLTLLAAVYGFRPALEYRPDERVEFSIHPLRRGFRHQHTIIWEVEQSERIELTAELAWPNRFSRFIGDKAFGLLIAHAIGLRVPSATVVPRRIAPFSLGQPTGSAEVWIRTCPVEQVPGLFTTRRGWLDPFRLMAAEDLEGVRIASVLAQRGVEATYSGAAVEGADGQIIIEGVPGTGEAFMQGQRPPLPLPPQVLHDVQDMFTAATKRLGPVRFEWVHDGKVAWCVQLHRGSVATRGQVLYPGEPKLEHRFPIEKGLGELRSLVERLEGRDEGIVLVGRVGVTSHLGDVLRRARIPSRIESPESEVPSS